MKKIIDYLCKHGIFLTLPFLLYLFYKKTLANYSTSFERICFGSIFYLLLLFSCFYFIKYYQEKAEEKDLFEFLLHTLGIALLLSLNFTVYYWCIFDYNEYSFINVSNNNNFFDLLHYSLGVFLMNSTSSVRVNDFYPKLFVMTQMLTAFITLILILSNYKVKILKEEN